MKILRTFAAAALPAVLLAGCALAPKPVTAPPPAPAPVREDTVSPAADSRAALSLLDTFQQWQAMPDDALGRELAAASRDYSREPNNTVRLRLALLLSLPSPAVHNDSRALVVLGPVLASAPANGPPGALRELALLLQTQIVERLRAVNEESKRGDDLAQKLEALRQLEHSLLERDQKARTK